MEGLGKYYKEENWQYVLENVVPIEFEKNKAFYERIREDGIFNDDVCKVLATFSTHIFSGQIDNYKKWLRTKQPMLDGFTPFEIRDQPRGVDTLKEYLLRYPKI